MVVTITAVFWNASCHVQRTQPKDAPNSVMQYIRLSTPPLRGHDMNFRIPSTRDLQEETNMRMFNSSYRRQNLKKK